MLPGFGLASTPQWRCARCLRSNPLSLVNCAQCHAPYNQPYSPHENEIPQLRDEAESMPMPAAGAYDWLDDASEAGDQSPAPRSVPQHQGSSAEQQQLQQLQNIGSGDPEVGMFIRATDVQWAKLVELGVTSMRKLIDYLAATDASARCNGAPAGVPVVLKRSLFNWCRDSGRQVHLEIEAAVACGYLIQGGVAPYEWLHCCPPGGVQAPPATQIAASAAGRDRSMYKSRLCRNWLQWGSCRYAECCQFAHGARPSRRRATYGRQRRRRDCAHPTTVLGRRQSAVHRLREHTLLHIIRVAPPSVRRRV